MKIFESIKKGISFIVDDIKKPESFKIGDEFENYIRDVIFPEEFYGMVERTHSYDVNKNDYVESSKNPDFTFRDKKTRKVFYVECKFRNDLFKGKLEWATKYQLKRYQDCEKIHPVFILIGLAGEEIPDIFLIPIKDIKYTGLFPSFLEKYRIQNDFSLSSKKLWDR